MRTLILLGTFLIIISCSQQAGNTDSDNQTEKGINDITVVLAVNGMTCEGCENAITKGVGAMDGIKEVKASHIDSTTIVVYDSSLVQLDLIAEKIDEVGYEVEGIKE